jgi:hypothetical protein
MAYRGEVAYRIRFSNELQYQAIREETDDHVDSEEDQEALAGVEEVDAQVNHHYLEMTTGTLGGKNGRMFITFDTGRRLYSTSNRSM